MKIIVLVCLLSFVAGELEFVHPNAHLIEEAHAALLSGKSSRIINGDDVQIDNYPWQASLQFGSSHICGAAVVSSKVAITAAHCLNPNAQPNAYNIRVGSTLYSGSQGTVIPVDNFIIHEAYDGNTGGFPNDIAILLFSEDITGTNKATAVPIPTDDSTFAGSKCQITGWGITESGGISDVLQKADTTVLTRSVCRSKWGNSILSSHVCVFNEDNGACNGDSGGPLTCSGTLVGVTSWGINGCDTGYYPSVYTRISSYRELD
ncbi:trypsin beta-like [Pecten maximus]|uniref:trypsin beta-like n=1 Tax=Pecten maximus TaxID=6579 RepID=UPI001458A05D|nr:trypsin beta-like [Pecten maximus]